MVPSSTRGAIYPVGARELATLHRPAANRAWRLDCGYSFWRFSIQIAIAAVTPAQVRIVRAFGDVIPVLQVVLLSRTDFLFTRASIADWNTVLFPEDLVCSQLSL